MGSNVIDIRPHLDSSDSSDPPAPPGRLTTVALDFRRRVLAGIASVRARWATAVSGLRHLVFRPRCTARDGPL